jgi:hypothetical protein
MSITLTTPFTFEENGVQVEDDTVGACVSFSMDYIGRIMTVVYKVGTLTGSPADLNIGPIAQEQGQTVTVEVYVGPNVSGGIQFGTWWLNGNLQNTLVPSGDLTTSITNLLAQRNSAESFAAVAGGLMPGTQVPWTQL